jgi:xanthine dehydrogenase small subunit
VNAGTGAGEDTGSVAFEVDGRPVTVAARGSLLDALREDLGVRSAKDGCSPQGQCGCCTVWVDGKPRVACVTPVGRVRGRSVTTIDGLAEAPAWAEAFAACGASQCGFCTPGIVMRLAALSPDQRHERTAVERALSAHLCRCTGWQTIVEAAAAVGGRPVSAPSGARALARAAVEGGVSQSLGPDVALGRGGFADDEAPPDALVAVRGADGDWVVAPTLHEARRASGKVQGRRTTAPPTWPLEVPPDDRGDGWVRTLRTTWVEPGYLEPDAAWAAPDGSSHGPLGNGGAFGGKSDGEVLEVARRLASEHGRPIRVLSTREDVVRHGPKRPPVAIGLRADATGAVRVARTAGIAEAIAAVAPDLAIEEVDVAGPTTSVALRGAGWVEAAVVMASLRPGPDDTVTTPAGATATARVEPDGSVSVRVRCGVDPDDPGETTVLRSYCIGAAHMALGWVRSEAVAVGGDGVPLDLTMRSFGILRAAETPPIRVTVDTNASPADVDELVSGSDAVFAAVAAAAWRHAGFPPAWPVGLAPSG